MIVQQTLWTVHITQLSAESRSESSTAALCKVGGGDQRRLSFLYDNAPQQKVRTGSPRHEGACSLNTAGYRPILMDGSYFTDRLTCGDVRLVKVADRAAALPYDELRRSFAEAIDNVASPS